MEESSTCCKHSQPENTEPVALKGSIAPSMCHEDGNIESLPHLLLTDLGFNQPFRSLCQKIARGMSLLESIKVFPKGYILNSKSTLRWLSQPLSMCTQVLQRTFPMKLQLHSTFGLANETPQKLKRLGFNLGN